MQPVLWTKGVLLSPQHLQTQDRFLEDRLNFQLSGLAYCSWGFYRLRVDHEALAGGSFAIGEASGILPDGLLFDMPESDPLPPPRALDPCWEPDRRELDVYLAIPAYQHGGRNVSAVGKATGENGGSGGGSGGGGGGGTRYGAEVLQRRDENTGLSEKPIQMARKNFRLLVEGESLEGSSVLRIARVRRSAAGEYQLDPHFVPPLIDIAGSDYLLTIARRLVEILSARSGTLAGSRRQKNQGLADFSIADIASFWLLYTINTHLPELRHRFETARGHPEVLFRTLLSLAGTLTTFSVTARPRDLPVYEHDDLSGCFTALDQQLRTLLDTVIPANCISIPLREQRQSIYTAVLDDDRCLAPTAMYLAVTSNAAGADAIRQVPTKLKLSSVDRIDHLIRQALPGIVLTHTPTPPPEVPVKVNYHYFELSRSGGEWDSLVSARSLAAYVPADFPGASLELLVVVPPER